jgi:hypothetical protein
MRSGLVTRTGAPDGTDPSVTEAVARLAEEFAGGTGCDVVRRVVLDCRQELDASPEAALPELLERLARQRLLRLGHRPPAAAH